MNKAEALAVLTFAAREGAKHLADSKTILGEDPASIVGKVEEAVEILKKELLQGVQQSGNVGPDRDNIHHLFAKY